MCSVEGSLIKGYTNIAIENSSFKENPADAIWLHGPRLLYGGVSVCPSTKLETNLESKQANLSRKLSSEVIVRLPERRIQYDKPLWKIAIDF